MSYECDTGGGKFRPNKDRGLWSRPSDFLFSCVLHAFRVDFVYGAAVIPFILRGGIYIIIAAIFNILLYGIPIIFIQSFLGQFSSSGLISAFGRLSPLCKGMGYIGLAMNLCSLAFYSVFSAVPILFLINTLQPTLPWSCDGFDHGDGNESYIKITHCNYNNSTLSSVEGSSRMLYVTIPSVEFFANKVGETFSFSLFGCILIVWIAVSLVLYNTTERIGQILRYCAITLITLLGIVFLRLACLTKAKHEFMVPIPTKGEIGQIELGIFLLSMVMFTSFGPGWGTVLSMASYNKFKTDITKYSWMICLSQMGVLVMLGMVCSFAAVHLSENKFLTSIFEYQWMSFLSIPSTLATLEFPHLWNWMFLTVLVIGSFNLVVVQMFSVLTAVFDEFEEIRPHRAKVIFGTSSVMALISGYFCTSHGIYFIEILVDLSIISQGLMNLFLLIIMLWVYGRERFQRDLEFMTSQVFATWKVYILRFITPLFLATTLFVGVSFSLYREGSFPHWVPIGYCLTLMPGIALPAYCIYRLLQTNGTIALRFKRCIRPTDWYPVQPEDRQRYEETVHNSETSQPLTAIVL